MYKSCWQPRHDPIVTRLHAPLLSALHRSSSLSKDPVNICTHSVRWWHFPGNKRQHLSSESTAKSKQWLLAGSISSHAAVSSQVLLTVTYTLYQAWISIVKADTAALAAPGAALQARCSQRNLGGLRLSGLLPLSRHDETT